MAFLAEAVDIDTSNIEFEFDGIAYKYTFYIENDEYLVEFVKANSYLFDDNTEGQYVIEFKGPKGYLLTGKNKNPSLVYSRVASAVVKFVEEYDAKMFLFSGSVSVMDLMYQIIADKLNKSAPEGKKFIRINEMTWLRQDAYQSLAPQDKLKVDGYIDTWSRKKDNYMKIRREMKFKERKFKMNVGNFFKNYDGLYMICKVDSGMVSGLTIHEDRLYDQNFFVDSIKSEIIDMGEMDRNYLAKFLMLINQPIKSVFVEIPQKAIERMKQYVS